MTGMTPARTREMRDENWITIGAIILVAFFIYCVVASKPSCPAGHTASYVRDAGWICTVSPLP